MLPTWIITKCVKRPGTFDWKTDLDERTLLLGVIYASGGNCSHAVTVHGGFVYNANELIAISLCQGALDYCTSTQKERSSSVNFRRIAFFITKRSGRKRLGKLACLSKLRIRSSTRRGLLERRGSLFCKQSVEICYSVFVNSSAHLSRASVSSTRELSSLRDITKHGASIVLGRTDMYSGDQSHS